MQRDICAGNEAIGTAYSAYDAHFIVRACNAHDELVAALQEIEEGCVMSRKGLYTLGDVLIEYQRIARAALAKVSK